MQEIKKGDVVKYNHYGEIGYGCITDIEETVKEYPFDCNIPLVRKSGRRIPVIEKHETYISLKNAEEFVVAIYREIAGKLTVIWEKD